MKTLSESIRTYDMDAAIERQSSLCGFKLWGMMPPCVLSPGHSGDHSDGCGGHYTNSAACGCGALLSAHEKTTAQGDCFGCRADRRKAVQS